MLHYPLIYQLSCTALRFFIRISGLAPTRSEKRGRSKNWYASEASQGSARQLVKQKG